MKIMSNVKRGDIVWARVNFPNTWFPALVLSSNNHLGISLSFFNNHHSIFSSRRTYFLHSELLPFDQQPFPFPSLISNPQNDNTFRASLHSALKLYGQRIVSSLRCRCQTGQEDDEEENNNRVRDGSGYNRFDPSRVLGFVLEAAVFPWVDHDAPGLVDVVRVVAQVHAFRDHSIFHQKKVYKETLKLDDNVRQLQCSSLGRKIHSVTQESTTLETKGEYEIVSKQGEKNMAIGAIRKLKPTVPVLEGNSEELFQNKPMIIQEALTTVENAELLMHSLGLGPIKIGGERLKLERHGLLRFKNILYHGMVDIRFGNGYTMSNYIRKRKDSAPGLCCRLPDIETTICLNRKRRRLDKHALCHVVPQTSRVRESDGNFNTSPRISNFKTVEPEESIQKDNQGCVRFSETNINFTDEVQKEDLKRCQNLTLQQSITCESSSNLVLGVHSDKRENNTKAVKVKYVLGYKSSVYQKRLQRSCGDITPPKSKESTSCLVEGKDCYPYVASRSTVSSKVRQQPKAHVPVSSKSLYMKFPKNFNLPSKEQLIKKFSVFGAIDYFKTKVSFYTGSARVAFFQEGDAVAAYQYAKRKVWYGEANVRFWLDPFEHKREYCKPSYPIPPSASREIGPPLKSCLKASNSLKKENKKKPYGVRFTIDPFEHQRGDSQRFYPILPSASKGIGPPLKSCIKMSNSLKKENKKKPCRVRFTIET